MNKNIAKFSYRCVYIYKDVDIKLIQPREVYVYLDIDINLDMLMKSCINMNVNMNRVWFVNIHID